MSARELPSADGPSSGSSRLPDSIAPDSQPPSAPGPDRSSPGQAPSPPPSAREPGPSVGAEPAAPEPAPGDRDLPWKATAERRDLWGPRESALEGTVRPPISKAVTRRGDRPGPMLRLGVPLLLGGLAALATVVLGIGAGLAGPLLTLAAAAGIGVVAAGGTGAAMSFLPGRQRPDRPVLEASISDGTREVLEQILAANDTTRTRVLQLRPQAAAAAAVEVLSHVDILLTRIDALVGSEQLQSMRPSAGEVTMLEGISTRYVPDLVDAAADIIGFLRTFAGSAREEALANLSSIDRQLEVLAEGVERIESDLVGGVSHSLEVHSEFLRARFADQHLDPIIDV